MSGHPARRVYCFALTSRWCCGPVLRAAARVVVFTADERAAVAAKYGIDPAQIEVRPNGVGETFSTPAGGSRGVKAVAVRGQALRPEKRAVAARALAGISERFETTLVGDGELEPT